MRRPGGETRESVERLFRAQRFAVLCTESDGGPYSSLIAFWAAGDLSHVVFATMRATRKFSNLASHPRIALLFDDRSNRDVDVQEATAVTATGTARELTGAAARSAASAAFLEKHPQLATFVADAGCALVRVDIDTLYVVTQFQNVVELTDSPLAPYYKGLDAGGNVFAGYETAGGLFFQLNTQFGMLKINPENKWISDDKSSVKNIGFGLSAGYRF